MSARVSITNAEIDALYDLQDGGSVGSPEHPLYDVLMGFIDKVARADRRPLPDGSEVRALADMEMLRPGSIDDAVTSALTRKAENHKAALARVATNGR